MRSALLRGARERTTISQLFGSAVACFSRMILLIDNYDSFTYNLVQRLGEVDSRLEIEVHRNDQITTAEIAAKKPTHLIHHDGQGIFKGLPNPLTATRYHSLVIRPDTLNPDFLVSAWAEAPDGS